jgi:hypothetical protein
MKRNKPRTLNICSRGQSVPPGPSPACAPCVSTGGARSSLHVGPRITNLGVALLRYQYGGAGRHPSTFRDCSCVHQPTKMALPSAHLRHSTMEKPGADEDLGPVEGRMLQHATIEPGQRRPIDRSLLSAVHWGKSYFASCNSKEPQYVNAPLVAGFGMALWLLR